MRNLRRIAFFAALAVLSCVSMARADNLLVAQYAPQINDRFYSPASDSDPAKAFIGDAVSPPLNFSGVGFTADGHWVTMISPSYFLSAAHFPPGAGTSVTFYPGNSTAQSYSFTVSNWNYVTSIPGLGTTSDLYLGQLTTPIPASDNITYYPVPVLGSNSAYSGQQIYVYGLPNRVGTNTIADVYTQNYGGHDTQAIDYLYNANVPNNAFLEPGCSGGPSFLDVNGQLALVGIHYLNATSGSTPVYSVDSFVPYYVNELDANMTGEQLTLVPEPAALVLLLSGAVIGLMFARRSQRQAMGTGGCPAHDPLPSSDVALG